MIFRRHLAVAPVVVPTSLTVCIKPSPILSCLQPLSCPWTRLCRSVQQRTLANHHEVNSLPKSGLRRLSPLSSRSALHTQGHFDRDDCSNSVISPCYGELPGQDRPITCSSNWVFSGKYLRFSVSIASVAYYARGKRLVRPNIRG